MTTLQIRNNIKKYIDNADEKAIKRIQDFIKKDKEIDCIDHLSEKQLAILDEAINEADKGLGEPHEIVMKKMKKKWLVK